MGNEHSEKYCHKEKEIAEMQTDLKNIKIAVMGNGKGLNITVPLLSQTVERLEGTVDGLQKGLSGFIKFQENMEGQHIGRAEIRKRNRWIIGLLAGALTAQLALIITLIARIS